MLYWSPTFKSFIQLHSFKFRGEVNAPRIHLYVQIIGRLNSFKSRNWKVITGLSRLISLWKLCTFELAMNSIKHNQHDELWAVSHDRKYQLLSLMVFDRLLLLSLSGSKSFCKSTSANSNESQNSLELVRVSYENFDFWLSPCLLNTKCFLSSSISPSFTARYQCNKNKG